MRIGSIFLFLPCAYIHQKVFPGYSLFRSYRSNSFFRFNAVSFNYNSSTTNLNRMVTVCRIMAYFYIYNKAGGDSYVKYDMNNNYPTVIDINSTGEKWKYKTEGHFMCISGYDNTGSTTYAYVADPHYKYAGTYRYEAEQVYNVNNNHWRHAVIW